MQYGFGRGMVRVSNKAELNQLVSDEQIYHHYLGDFIVDEPMISPRGESNPSFKIDMYEGKLMWRDFGYDVRPGDAINLVQYLEDLQGRKLTYHAAMQKILEDVDASIPYKIDVANIEKVKPDLRVRYRHKFKDFEAEYWKQRRISKATCRRFNVYPAEIWYNDRCWHHSRVGDPLFVYLFDDVFGIWKGYRPFAPTGYSRFIESECGGYVQGWDRLEDGDICIITKSYKDVMSYYELGITACAPQSESQFCADWQVAELRERYPRLLINYDPDEAGLRNMKRYSEQFDIPYFHFGDEGIKDLTDLREIRDDQYVKKVLRHLTKYDNI